MSEMQPENPQGDKEDRKEPEEVTVRGGIRLTRITGGNGGQ